jgi:hypothetical protein
MQHGFLLHCHSSATPATIQPTITLLHARITNCVIRFAGCRPAGVASGGNYACDGSSREPVVRDRQRQLPDCQVGYVEMHMSIKEFDEGMM